MSCGEWWSTGIKRGEKFREVYQSLVAAVTVENENMSSKGEQKSGAPKAKKSLFEVKKEIDEQRVKDACEELAGGTSSGSDWTDDDMSDIEVLPETPQKKVKTNSGKVKVTPTKKTAKKERSSPRKQKW